MLGEAIATAAHRLGAARTGVLARLGGPRGDAARAAAAELARLDAGHGRLRRAQWMAESRLVWPANLRAMHPTWLEAAIADLPPRARAAVANGGGEPIDVWLARRALAPFAAMPARTVDVPRVPSELPALRPEALRAWLERAGADQLARAAQLAGADTAAVAAHEPELAAALAAARVRIELPPRRGGLGADRRVLARCAGLAADDTRLVRLGARAVAPHLTGDLVRQLVQRLPRALGLVVRGELRAFAVDADLASWPALSL